VGYAISMNDWKYFKLLNAVVELPVPEPGTFEIEIWSYSPLLFQEKEMVDQFSLLPQYSVGFSLAVAG
ncbi:MAG: hypothetical protein ACOYM3_27015, partial [Terrimicrobiaceae bacterium]